MSSLIRLNKFWKNKKVFLTGHTGFKGTWFSIFLKLLGAKIYGYSLKPNTSPNLFNLTKLDKNINKSIFGDIRDPDSIDQALDNCDAVINLAAMISVPYSFKNPQSFIDTNIYGVLNLFRACRKRKKKIKKNYSNFFK